MAQAALHHAHRQSQSEAFRRHRPEETVLYQCVEAHWPEFREHAEETGGLPKFVVREFEAYLRCGRLQAGCLHLRCADGRLDLTLKSIWRDGTRAMIFEPHDLLARLVAAVPPPNFHLLRYFGVLSSHSALRSEVVPELQPDPAQSRPLPAPGDQLELLHETARACTTAGT